MGVEIEADIVLTGGNVITLDLDKPRAQGIAIKNGRLLWAGSDEEVREAIGKKTRVRKLEGLTVVPGFNDAHNHTLLYGLNLLRTIDLSPARSIKEILNFVKVQATRQEEGSWIVGFGYNHNEIDEKRHPTRWELDGVAPHHPVTLKHCNYHVQVANSKALSLAGITRSTPDPEGGRIAKDDRTADPTGLLYELPAIKLVENVIPKPSHGDLIEALKMANQQFLSEGITSSTDAGEVGAIGVSLQIAAYQEAVERGILRVRQNVAIWNEALVSSDDLDGDLSHLESRILTMAMGFHSGFGNERLRIGPIKIVVDGALSSGTAATFEPYGVDSGNQSTGMLIFEQTKLLKLISAAHALGWQLALHSIGDKAIDLVLDSIGLTLQKNPRENTRHRIEHCAIVNSHIIDRMRQLKILAILQPGFIWELGDSWIRQLGSDRVGKVKPFRTLLDENILVAFSSDRPVIKSASPLLGIHAAANEATLSGQDFVPGEKISAEEALRCYTLNGAYASFEEGVKGSIQVGKFADLVLLTDDPTKVPPEKIKDIMVKATMVGGEFVYENEDL